MWLMLLLAALAAAWAGRDFASGNDNMQLPGNTEKDAQDDRGR
jgi:hypothetical protein